MRRTILYISTFAALLGLIIFFAYTLNTTFLLISNVPELDHFADTSSTLTHLFIASIFLSFSITFIIYWLVQQYRLHEQKKIIANITSAGQSPVVKNQHNSVSSRTDSEALPGPIETLIDEITRVRNQLNLLLDTIIEGVIGIDKNGYCTFANQSSVRILGYKNIDEIIGTNITDLIYGGKTSFVDSPVYSCIQSGNSIFVNQADFYRKEGSIVPVEYWAHPKAGETNIHDAIITFLDHTEQRLYQQALLDERDIATKYFNAANVFMLALDRNGNIGQVNDYGCKLLGYEQEYLVGRNWFDNFIPENISHEVKAVFFGLISGEKERFQHYINDIKCDSGKTLRTLSWSNSYLEDEHGEIESVLSSGRDITEQITIEKELENERKYLEKTVSIRTRDLEKALKDMENVNFELRLANRTKSHFLTNISHEFRTPLNAIIGYSDLLKEQYYGDLNERQIKYVSSIEQSGIHLLALINDLLDISKIDTGTLELECNLFTAADVIQSSLSMLKNQIDKKNITVTYDVDKDTPAIYADERRIRQILINLLSNSIKYTDAGGKIHINTWPADHYFNFEVTDNGIGLDAEEQRQVFVEFYQADQVRDQQLGGSGIGLAICKKLVELHDGNIGVRSEKGKGSTFYFRIPVHNSSSNIEQSNHHSDETNPAIENKNIMLVEDNPISAKYMEALLAHYGCNVITAENGQVAIESLKKIKPDLVFMDIRMPVMDGITATRNIRSMEEYKDLPIIALSATTGSDAIQQQLEAGCDEHVPKPVNAKTILKILKRYLNTN